MAMNLGNKKLHHVNASRPQLQHSESKQSVAASEDYYSFSDHSAHSHDDPPTVIYQTPPSKNGSAKSSNDPTSKARAEEEPIILPIHTPSSTRPPTPQKQIKEPEQFIQAVTVPQAMNTTTKASQKEVSFEEPPSSEQSSRPTTAIKLPPTPIIPGRERNMQRQEIQRRPVPVQTRPWRDSHIDPSAPTPGVDDTPYIQFAIDQLTRDEELSGRSRDSRDGQDVSSMSSRLTVARGNVMSPRISGIDTPAKQSSSNESKPNIVGASSSQAEPLPPVVPPKSASRPFSRAVSPAPEERNEPRHHVLIPVNPHNLDLRYPPLDFVPRSLRLASIMSLVFFCSILEVLLIISCVLGAEHDGLLGYDGVGTDRYFVFEYLPQFLATLVILWLLVMQNALQRILPFVLLTKANHYPEEDVFNTVPLYITNFSIPNRTLLRQREPVFKYCAVIFWFTLFTIPLTSSLYQTRFYSAIDGGSFTWTTVQPVSIILIIMYFLLIVALILIHLRLSRHRTGLKWDPISLADIFVLIRRTSNLSARVGKSLSGRSSRPVSIGYWESPSRPGNIFHGIGTARPSIGHDPEKDAVDASPASGDPVQASTFESWQSQQRSKSRGTPWFLRDTFLLLFSLTALALLIAFLVVTYLNNQLLSGFLPLLPSADSSTSSFQSFSPANFLYSFLPALLGLVFPLFWLPIDTAFRYLQPFVNLSSAHTSRGISAENSLLLSYPSELPLIAAFQALLNRHLRLAWTSLITFFSWSIPILAGGIFTAQYISPSPSETAHEGTPSTSTADGFAGQIVMRPDAHALYCLTVFLILYTLSWFVLLLPGGGKRMLVSGQEGGPVDVRYLGGIREVVGESVLGAEMWREPRSRADLVGRVLGVERESGGWRMIGGRIMKV